MTKDEIIKLAREAGFVSAECWPHEFRGLFATVERFAHLVAAQEREACAKIADEIGDRDTDTHAYDAAAAIRARSWT